MDGLTVLGGLGFFLVREPEKRDFYSTTLLVSLGGGIVFVFVTKLLYSLSLNTWREDSFTMLLARHVRKENLFILYSSSFNFFASICKNILVS